MDSYEQDRRVKLANLRAAGIDPYGKAMDAVKDNALARYDWEYFLSSLVGKQESEVIAAMQKGYQNGPRLTLGGRIVLLRNMGKLAFATIRDDTGDIQIGMSKKLVLNGWLVVENLDLGDQILVTGNMGTTKTGEVTLWAENVAMSCKSVSAPPAKVEGLQDVEKRYRQRYVDLWSNPDGMKLLRFRSHFIQAIRECLFGLDFIEAETPMLHPISGGAAAKPFITEHNALDRNLYLRIAPELYLKRLLVAGVKRVFEINRNFRNEGISTKHNPEFTALELYQSYADYNVMMDTVESIIKLAIDRGGYVVSEWYRNDYAPTDRLKIIYPNPRWRRVRMDTLVAEHAAANNMVNLGATPEQIHAYYEKYVEPEITDPTFVTHLPASMVPLAKRSGDGYAECFEFIVNGMEIGCGYSEQTDPDQQLEAFTAQSNINGSEIDLDFIEALKVGMPPAGGLGIGIDRLVMALTGTDCIRDVIAFPLMRPKDVDHIS